MKESLTNDREEFNMIIYDIANHPTVLQMKNFRQHYDTSCYEHCMEVAYYSYLICKKLRLDYTSVARSGMLHDLFLYDWRVKSPEHKGLHGFRHPRIALNNSMKIFSLSKKEQDIILKHMWPLTVVPSRYIESYIVSSVDKYCAIKESMDHYFEFFKTKKLFRYVYLSLCLMFIQNI
ncbi:MAG TPA: HD family phosphohydrolase [Clostridiaceae bacterium]|jgi:uncharacterized protein|nr:HD family phosphohydrolase [Clostridiaceae bacterium]